MQSYYFFKVKIATLNNKHTVIYYMKDIQYNNVSDKVFFHLKWSISYNWNNIIFECITILQYSDFTSPNGVGVLGFYAKLNQHMAYVIFNVNALIDRH